MPVVQITILPQTAEKKKELAVGLTNEIHRITGIPKEVISIAFYELPADNFATNGIMVSEKLKNKPIPPTKTK